jgi:hypothetical protein
MKAPALIRWSTVVAVVVVAGIAGWASYEHAYAVVVAHGEHGMVARLYPGTIDGLVYTASMVLLAAAQRHMPAPALAKWMLGLGIAATLAANLDSGIGYGPLGAIVAAWPAPALVGSYEMLMWLVRSSSRPEPAPGGAPEPAPEGAPAFMDTAVSVIPAPAFEGAPETNGRVHPKRTRARARKRIPGAPVTDTDAALHYAADLAAGDIPSQRRIRADLHVGQDRAREIRSHLEECTRT